MRLGVLISGRGSNLKAILDACSSGELKAEVALVISNKADAIGIQHAEKAGIKTVVISHKDFTNREDFDRRMDAELEAARVNLVCLAGFMRVLCKWFVDKWQGRIINIHPSLLPAFKGLNAQQQAIDAGVAETGCTVHYVTAGVDEGEVILQRAIPILSDDNAKTLSERLIKVEHECYIDALKVLISRL